MGEARRRYLNPTTAERTQRVHGLVEATTLAKFTSWSGKYVCFLAIHIVAGYNCYDVGALDTTTKVVIRRHYKEGQNAHGFRTNEQTKTEALAFFNEFRTGMTKAPKGEEDDDPKIWIN